MQFSRPVDSEMMDECLCGPEQSDAARRYWMMCRRSNLLITPQNCVFSGHMGCPQIRGKLAARPLKTSLPGYNIEKCAKCPDHKLQLSHRWAARVPCAPLNGSAKVIFETREILRRSRYIIVSIQSLSLWTPVCPGSGRPGKRNELKWMWWELIPKKRPISIIHFFWNFFHFYSCCSINSS